jgi:hypothetical protein
MFACAVPGRWAPVWRWRWRGRACRWRCRGAAARPAREDVRTYALSATSVQLLTTLKVWDALPADARTAVYDMHIEGDRPGAALHFSAWDQGVETLTWIVDAAALNEALDSRRVASRRMCKRGARRGRSRPAGAGRRQGLEHARQAGRGMSSASATTRARWRPACSPTSRTQAWRASGSARPTCWRCCPSTARSAGDELRPGLVGATGARRGAGDDVAGRLRAGADGRHRRCGRPAAPVRASVPPGR